VHSSKLAVIAGLSVNCANTSKSVKYTVYTWFIVKSNNKHIMLRLHNNADKHGGEKRRKYNKLLLKSWL